LEDVCVPCGTIRNEETSTASGAGDCGVMYWVLRRAPLVTDNHIKVGDVEVSGS
jgi:hypothetical protein